jgi:phage antirepressor YoqD-like protein
MLSTLQNQSALTMTSREIAELTGKDHSHVMRDAYRMLDQLGYSKEKIDGCHQEWIHPQNKQRYYELCLNRDETLCLVAGYSAPMRMKIIQRWQELESKNHQAIPQTFAEALQLAANQAAELEAARPAVQFVEKYVESTGNMGFRQVAKLLRIKENDFRAFLQDKKIMYRLGSQWMPYASHIDAGRFYVTTGTSDTDHAYSTAKFTPKGVEWVAKLWGSK